MPRTRLVALIAAVAVIAAITVAAVVLLTSDSKGEPAVTLVGVPQAEIDARHLTLAEADLDEARIDRLGILEIADRTIACAQVRQSELVTLTNRETGDVFVAWAINYDTRTANEYPALGGFFRTGCTRSDDFYVWFFDARTGKLVYALSAGYGYQYSADPAIPEGLTPEQLAAAGIGLEAPPGGSSTVDPPAYEDISDLPALPGIPIHEVLLARLTDDVGGAAGGRLVWVVTTDATCEPDYESDDLYCEPKPTLALLDAYTHEFLYATEVG